LGQCILAKIQLAKLALVVVVAKFGSTISYFVFVLSG